MRKSESKPTRKHKSPRRNDEAENSKSCWKIPTIIVVLVLVAVTSSLLHHYFSPQSPMECYYCTWISHSDGPLLVEDPCGRDQRLLESNATVKVCDADQPYCGVLHMSFSYKSKGEIPFFLNIFFTIFNNVWIFFLFRLAGSK